jgi:hypothetical protein
MHTTSARSATVIRGGAWPKPESGSSAKSPIARRPLPMAKHLTDPAIEEEIQALARTAPQMTADQAVRVASQ